MKCRKFAAVALGLITAAATTPAHAEWLEATTAHFVIVGDMSDDQLRHRALRLEQLHTLLATIAPARSENRLLIYMTTGVSDVQSMGHMDNIAGYYVPTASGAFAVSPEQVEWKMAGWTPEVVLFHEYTHHMLLQTNDEYFPGWVTEGLAELFATTQFKPNGDMLVGVANQSRASGMFSFNRWPVDRLLRSDTLKIEGEESVEKYTRGGLLVHYLLMDKARAPQFGHFISLINHGTGPVSAGTQAFGDLKKLDAALDNYRRKARVPSVLYSTASLQVDKSIKVRTVNADEAEALTLRLESSTDDEHKWSVDLLGRARRLMTKYPGSAFAFQTLAQAEYEAANYELAGAAADRVLAIDPNNLMALLYKGRAMGQKAIVSKSRADWVAARALFLQANRLQPDHPWPFLLLYDSYGAAGQPVPAGIVTGLRRAVVLAPQDEDVRVRMALQLLKEGDVAGSRLMIAPVAFSPHGNPDAPAAKFYPILAASSDQAELNAKAIELKLPVNSFVRKLPKDAPKTSN